MSFAEFCYPEASIGILFARESVFYSIYFGELEHKLCETFFGEPVKHVVHFPTVLGQFLLLLRREYRLVAPQGSWHGPEPESLPQCSFRYAKGCSYFSLPLAGSHALLGVQQIFFCEDESPT